MEAPTDRRASTEEADCRLTGRCQVSRMSCRSFTPAMIARLLTEKKPSMGETDRQRTEVFVKELKERRLWLGSWVFDLNTLTRS